MTDDWKVMTSIAARPELKNDAKLSGITEEMFHHGLKSNLEVLLTKRGDLVEYLTDKWVQSLSMERVWMHWQQLQEHYQALLSD